MKSGLTKQKIKCMFGLHEYEIDPVPYYGIWNAVCMHCKTSAHGTFDVDKHQFRWQHLKRKKAVAPKVRRRF